MIFDSALSSGSVYAGSKAFEYVKGFKEARTVNYLDDLTSDELEALVKYSGKSYKNINNSLKMCIRDRCMA